MPPFTQQPKIPEVIPELPHEGMDSQTKNVILFAVIFSVLAAGVLMFVFLKPHKSSDQTSQESAVNVGTSTPNIPSVESLPSSDTTEQKSPSFSFFNISSLFKPRQTPNMFGDSGSATNNTPSTGTNATKKSGGVYQHPDTTISASTASTEEQKQQEKLLKELEGVYGETSATQEYLAMMQLGLQSSPLRGKIWISSVRRSSNANDEYITLTSNKSLPEGTLLTEMTLKSLSSGQAVQIGKGVGFPVTNSLNAMEEIRVSPEQKVFVISGRSPLGYSFKNNKCAGYFEQFQNFTPALPLQCPLLKDEPLPRAPNQLSDTCLDRVNRFPRCQISTEQTKSVVTDQENDCIQFIQDRTGYSNCVLLHRNDTDFQGKEWRIYLNWNQPIWKSRREIIWLLDQNGLFISQYSY